MLKDNVCYIKHSNDSQAVNMRRKGEDRRGRTYNQKPMYRISDHQQHSSMTIQKYSQAHKPAPVRRGREGKPQKLSREGMQSGSFREHPL